MGPDRATRGCRRKVTGRRLGRRWLLHGLQWRADGDPAVYGKGGRQAPASVFGMLVGIGGPTIQASEVIFMTSSVVAVTPPNPTLFNSKPLLSSAEVSVFSLPQASLPICRTDGPSRGDVLLPPRWRPEAPAMLNGGHALTAEHNRRHFRSDRHHRSCRRRHPRQRRSRGERRRSDQEPGHAEGCAVTLFSGQTDDFRVRAFRLESREHDRMRGPVGLPCAGANLPRVRQWGRWFVDIGAVSSSSTSFGRISSDPRQAYSLGQKIEIALDA